MEKNHPYYGKSMSTNFLGSPHTMDSVAFCRTMENTPIYGLNFVLQITQNLKPNDIVSTRIFEKRKSDSHLATKQSLLTEDKTSSNFIY